jgi:hypothetical protein
MKAVGQLPNKMWICRIVGHHVTNVWAIERFSTKEKEVNGNLCRRCGVYYEVIFKEDFNVKDFNVIDKQKLTLLKVDKIFKPLDSYDCANRFKRKNAKEAR